MEPRCELKVALLQKPAASYLLRGVRLLDGLRSEGGREQTRSSFSVQQVVLVLNDALADGRLNLGDDPFKRLRLNKETGFPSKIS